MSSSSNQIMQLKHQPGMADVTAIQLMEAVQEMFSDHVREEMSRYSAIQDEVRANRLASERRHDDVVSRLDALSHSTISIIEKQNALITELSKTIKRGFPGEDPDGHRRAHETIIQDEKDRREFRLKLKHGVVQWVVIIVLGWLGIVVWNAFLQGPK